MTGRTCSLRTETVPPPSIKFVESLMPLHKPENRDSAIPCSPKSTISCGSQGDRTVMPFSAMAISELLGMADDFAITSSPTKTSAPPVVDDPPQQAWRSASVARSRPGVLPYQIPTTPSWVSSPKFEASCEPWTAVAANSSLSPGMKVTSCASSNFFCRANSRSSVPSGEPG